MGQYTEEQVEKAIEALDKRTKRTVDKKATRTLVRTNRAKILEAVKVAKLDANVIKALGKVIGMPQVG